MINTSNEYKSRIRKNRKFFKISPLILANGTALNLVDSDFINDGFRIDDSVGEKVALGTVVINKCTYYLNNFSGKFNSYDFTDAVLRPQSGLQLSETVEYLPKGVFTVDNPGAKGSIIVLEALDNMAKLNTEFSGVMISFPCTNQQLLQAVCLHCGVSLSTVSFLNSGYINSSRPADEAISCREVVSWIAQMAGCFARCNTVGALELKWYDFEVFEQQTNIDGGTFDSSAPYASGDNIDGGNFIDYNSGDSVDGGNFTEMGRYHHLFSFSGNPIIGTDDIVITGIQVTDSAETTTTVLYGTSGYVLPIAGNPLIQNSTQASMIASSVGARIVGMRFRQFSGSLQSDPSMEAGDVAYMSDRKGNSYQTLLTSLSYTPGNYEPVSCGAETPARKSYRPTPEMKAIVESRRVAKQEISNYDLVVQQFLNLMTYGFGLYKSEEILPDGSIIYYMHDKPTIAQSGAVWKFGSNGILLSTDKGITWGVDTNGNMLVNVLTAIGINAEWIQVVTSFTVGDNFSVNAMGELMAKAGQIGPFTLNDDGLFSEQMEFFDDGTYPLIWLSKPGTNGESFDTGADGSAKANYEPSVAIVRSIEGGIYTEIMLMARNDLAGKTGKITIDRVDLSTGLSKSKTEITENGIGWTQFTSAGGILSSTQIISNGILIQQNGKNASVMLDTNTGDLHISASGDVYIKGMKQ
jgi:hypothetical protein